MEQFFEEYGDALLEVLGALLFLGIIVAIFCNGSFLDFVKCYISSVTG